MNKSRFTPFFLMLLSIVVLLSGCKKDDPTPEDENELITTVRLKFTDGTNVQTFQWQDLDGDDHPKRSPQSQQNLYIGRFAAG